MPGGSFGILGQCIESAEIACSQVEGVSWTPSRGPVIRGAWFQVLRPSSRKELPTENELGHMLGAMGSTWPSPGPKVDPGIDRYHDDPQCSRRAVRWLSVSSRRPSMANVMQPTCSKRPKVLAVASGGGHWVELRRIAPALAGADVLYVTVEPSYRNQIVDGRFCTVPDATRCSRWGLVKLAISVLRIVIRERPDVVISTGAAPGYLAIRIGRLFGARTMWIDSIANAEELSLSGRKILRHADRCLTQWPHLAAPDGPEFSGAVL